MRMQQIAFAARGLVAALATILSTGMTTAGSAQSPADSYPDKPIRIIVPFPAGGSVDVIGRVVGQKLNEAWGQPVLIENRPGASTMIGTGVVAKADPDGYTLIVVVSNHTTNSALHPKMPYDALKDFAPIIMMARTPVVLYAHPSLPADNLKELAALAKTKPGELNFGSAGVGSMTHLTAELFKTKAGIDLTHVLYRGGTPAMNDLLAGHIPMQFATVAQALPQYRAKQLKALGISSAQRYPSMMEVPTFVEQGFDVVTTEWFGLLAPAGTPQPIIAKINAEVNKALKMPGLGDRLSAIEITGSTPQELDTFIRSETDRWGPMITQLGLKAE
jgi:tripartite-type tricarboxylate transporter receptor subunit TctC